MEPDAEGNVEVQEGVTSWNDLTDRPFGEPIGERAIIENIAVPASGIEISSLALTAGQEYTVIWNDTRYENVVAELLEDDDGSAILIGNPVIFGDADNGLPFACACIGGAGAVIPINGVDSIVTIMTMEYTKIPNDYLPSSGAVVGVVDRSSYNARYLNVSRGATADEIITAVENRRPVFLIIEFSNYTGVVSYVGTTRHTG